MKERYKSAVIVWLCLFDKSGSYVKVLLQKRQNTGYMDGRYDLAASGHLEPGESLTQAVIREAKEEIGITIMPEDLELTAVYDTPEEGYLKFYFTAKKWQGEPKIMEPEKCSELLWARLETLPDNMIPYLPEVLENIWRNEGASFYGINILHSLTPRV